MTIALADVLLGHVVAVSDGDTITVLDETSQRHVIRLMAIDAPEKAQAFGQKAKESLANLVFKKYVSVTWFKRDRYGRTLG
jgi:endonuclease YncB( thermonuclease family)